MAFGDVRAFIRAGAMGMRDNPDLTTRVLAFPPRVELQTGINAFVDSFNEKMIPDNVFMNTGVARTTSSRYPGPDFKKPYFIVVAEQPGAGAGWLRDAEADAVLDWPKEHYGIVVERRPDGGAVWPEGREEGTAAAETPQSKAPARFNIGERWFPKRRVA